MDLQTLKNIISGALKGTDFSLQASALGPTNASARQLLNQLFAGGDFSLSAASVDTSSDQPSVKGKLSGSLNSPYGFLQGMAAEAVFSLADKAVQVNLTITPASDWALSEAIPGLKNSIANVFTWSNASVLFDTTKLAKLPANFPASYGFPPNAPGVTKALKTGMLFKTELEYNGANAGIKWLLGDQKLQMSGPVEWDGELARMDLTSQPLNSLTLEKWTLPLQFHLVAVLMEVKPKPESSKQISVPLAAFTGDLGKPPGSPANLTIPFYVELYQDQASIIRASGDFTEASSLALKEVATLLGVDSLQHQQGEGFPTLQDLALRNVSLGVNTQSKQLINTSATLEFKPKSGPWKPFGENLLSFDDFLLTFLLIGPFKKPTFETIIECVATLAGGTLDATLILPELEFSCVLENGDENPINLTTVLDDITDKAFTKLTPKFELLCTDLKVLGNKSQGNYRFQATVKDNWEFDALGAKFALSSIAFDLTRQTGKTPVTTGQVVAVLEVASVPVQISADYSGGQEGWDFSGETLGLVDIKLTDLVAEALDMFGLHLPTDAPEVDITHLQMMLQTGNMDFGFTVAGKVEIAGTEIDIEVDLGRTHDNEDKPQETTTTFMGYLAVAGQYFEVDFSTSPADKRFTFEWKDKAGPLTLNEMARAFGLGQELQLPSMLNLGLKEASFTYDFTATDKIMILTAETEDGSKAMLIMLKTTVLGTSTISTKYLIGISLDIDVDLADLPLLGKALGPGHFKIQDFQFFYASAALTAAEVEKCNAVISQLKDPPPLLPTVSGTGSNPTTTVPASSDDKATIVMTKGLSFKSAINLGAQQSTIMALPTGSSQAGSAEAGAGDNGPTKPKLPQSSGTWISIQKTIGPVTIERIGGRYQSKKIWFLVSGSIDMGALSLSLEGLGIGATVTPDFNITKDLAVTISGIGLSFRSGPVDISGAFLKSKTLQNYFDGYALIKTSKFTIDAYGGYGTLPNGDHSVFAYASVDVPLGGPAFFFVTGFSLGFGYNMSFKIPTVREVSTFPLLDTSLFKKAGLDTNPGDALQLLNQYVRPKDHSLWFAFGIHFSSFEIIQSKALLVVNIYKEQIFLLGESTLVLPQAEENQSPYINVRLGLVVYYKIREGIFSARARIADGSYLLDPKCRVFGEFVAMAWFKGVHKGNFVLSIGGYHPRFKKPGFYPSVQRVGFDWPVTTGLEIKGSLYFALTPSAVMAGFRLSVTYHVGPLHAWLIALADLLLQWKPFKYAIQISISLGASFSIFSLEMGAGLSVHGPPMGGSVHISWYIISFTIKFGAEADKKPPRLTWAQFKTNFLPLAQAEAKSTNQQINKINIAGGLLKKVKGKGGEEWVVRADELILNTTTLIPSKSFTLASPKGDRLVHNPATASIGIRPMALRNLRQSNHKVFLKYNEGIDGNNDPEDLDRWLTIADTTGFPAALWATTPVKPHTPEAKTVEAGSGLTLLAPKSVKIETVDVTRITNFSHDNIVRKSYLNTTTDKVAYSITSTEHENTIPVIAKAIATTKIQRLALISEVNTLLGLSGSQEISDNLHNFADQMDENFQSAPKIGTLDFQSDGEQVVKPHEEPAKARNPWAAPQYPSIRLGQALRLFGYRTLADETQIQRHALIGKMPYELYIYPGSIFFFDLVLPEKINAQLSYNGGEQALQVLAFDDLLRITDYHLSDASAPLNLYPAGTEATQLVLYGLPKINSKLNVCGWTGDFLMPIINNFALLGKEVIVRPQAPYMELGSGEVQLSTVLRSNEYQGEADKYYAGWMETVLFAENPREIIIQLERTDQDYDLTSNLVVTTPYQIDKGITTFLDQNPLKMVGKPQQVGAYWRVKYECKPTDSGSGKGIAIRAQIAQQAQQSNSLNGVFILCSDQAVDADVWLKPDLADMISGVAPATGTLPKLTIKYQKS